MKKYTYHYYDEKVYVPSLKLETEPGDNACDSPKLNRGVLLSLYVEDLLMVFGKKEYYLIVPAFWRDRIWTFDGSECLQ
jgi:hypothetical protein